MVSQPHRDLLELVGTELVDASERAPPLYARSLLLAEDEMPQPGVAVYGVLNVVDWVLVC